MLFPFSWTTISSRASRRRARAAALRPAATPPMTTNAIALLLLFFQFLHEIENVEGFDFAVGEKAVDRVLLVVENLEDRGELGHDQKLHGAAAEADQLDVSARFACTGSQEDESAQAGA